jgi:uroporphyrinogen decarboxylase
MNSRERTARAVSHQEPDRIPFDLGGMAQSGIHADVYAALGKRLGLPQRKTRILNFITQTARLDEDFRQRLAIDTYLVYGQWANPETAVFDKDSRYYLHTDEWAIGRRKPKVGGLYFDIYRHPLSGDHWQKRLESFSWPDPLAPERFEGLRKDAEQARTTGRYVVLMGLCPGVMEVSSWLRGFESFFMDLVAEPKAARMVLERVVELKAAYWERARREVGDCVDAVNEADDLASQSALIFSPQTYRDAIKPLHKELFAAIKRAAPHVKIIFHSCGAVRQLIPDLIDIGVDVLNPVQLGAVGMNPFELKREFGRDICFWGGGVDAQNVLGGGSPAAIAERVRRNIEALAPGGGWVFSPDHIVQADVPPDNLLAMWDALQDLNRYPSCDPRSSSGTNRSFP